MWDAYIPVQLRWRGTMLWGLPRNEPADHVNGSDAPKQCKKHDAIGSHRPGPDRTREKAGFGMPLVDGNRARTSDVRPATQVPVAVPIPMLLLQTQVARAGISVLRQPRSLAAHHAGNNC